MLIWTIRKVFLCSREFNRFSLLALLLSLCWFCVAHDIASVYRIFDLFCFFAKKLMECHNISFFFKVVHNVSLFRMQTIRQFLNSKLQIFRIFQQFCNLTTANWHSLRCMLNESKAFAYSVLIMGQLRGFHTLDWAMTCAY